MTSSNNLDENFAACRRLAAAAAAADCALLALPECFAFIGEKVGLIACFDAALFDHHLSALHALATVALPLCRGVKSASGPATAQDTDALAIAEPLGGPLMARYAQLAREHNLWLSLGGFQEAPSAGARGHGTHRYNTHVLLDSAGALAASYRKVHLFDLDIPGKVTLRESGATLPGAALCVADSPVGRLGLSVCYDLRFPEFFQARSKPFETLFCSPFETPSAPLVCNSLRRFPLQPPLSV